MIFKTMLQTIKIICDNQNRSFRFCL